MVAGSWKLISSVPLSFIKSPSEITPRMVVLVRCGATETGWTSSGVCRVTAVAVRTMYIVIAVVSRVTGCAELCAHMLSWAAVGCVTKSLTFEATPRVRNVGSNMKFSIAGFKSLG
ncbi:uncharacterized protein LOC142563813 isoform X2 [Dermacentor variabilis]|uniref:uncharacterized protein LOC142563813 isoform X2 n=1 Tax=Dermacentor variabilis TaxID=34621 RepID=UPI003F5BF7EA